METVPDRTDDLDEHLRDVQDREERAGLEFDLALVRDDLRDAQLRIESLEACVRFMCCVRPDKPSAMQAELKRWADVYQVDV